MNNSLIKIKYSFVKFYALLIFSLVMCSCSNVNIVEDAIETTSAITAEFNLNDIKDDASASNVYDISTTSIAKENIVNYLNMPLIHGKNDTYFLEMEKPYLPGMGLYEEFYKKYILDLIKQVAAKYCGDEKNFVLVIAPNKSTVYRDFLGNDNYNLENETAPSRTIDFIKYLQENSNIKIVYPLYELTKAREFGQTYYRLDSHWTDFGAYVAASKMIETLGGSIPAYGKENVFESAFAFVDADCIPTPKQDDFNTADKICGILGSTDKSIDEGSIFRKYEVQVYGKKVVDGYALDPKDQRRLVMIDDSMGYGMIRPVFPYFRDTTFLQFNSVSDADPKYLKNADIFVVEVVERNTIELMPRLVELMNKNLDEVTNIAIQNEDDNENGSKVINTIEEIKPN